jgi:TATA-box binding protein (TBP) (component of TFIID and TFIIIB)
VSALTCYYWPDEPSCLLTIPTNGEVIVTGVETLETAEEAVTHLKGRIAKLF